MKRKLFIILERVRDGRVHRTRLEGFVNMHLELLDRLINRYSMVNPAVEIEGLINQVVDKG